MGKARPKLSVGIGRLNVGSFISTPGMAGRLGRGGNLGSATPRLSVGIGRLSAGSWISIPGIAGRLGRPGMVGNAKSRLSVGIGRLTEGRGGIAHLLMIYALALKGVL